MTRPNDDFDDRQFGLQRLLVGRTHPYAPESGPLANDVVLVLIAIALLVGAIVFPTVGGPVLVLYLVYLGLRWWRRSKLPYSRR